MHCDCAVISHMSMNRRRCLARVGGAAGTIAKSISAYDMSISDSMYGACARCDKPAARL
jgi:hypothetical protein